MNKEQEGLTQAELDEALCEDDAVGEIHGYFVAMGLAEGDKPEELDSLDLEEQLDVMLKAGEAAADTSDFGDLDSLLGEALAERDGKLQARELRAKLKDSRTPSADRKGIESRLREWEARQEWLTLANITLFVRQTCACGNVVIGYGGLMHRQAHRTSPHSRRWITARSALADLPNEVVFEAESVPMCPACALIKGWDLSKGEVLVDRAGLRKLGS